MTKYEKEVCKVLEKAGLKINEDFFWEHPNYWGDRHQNAWGFWIKEIQKRKIKDLDKYLIKIGLNPVDITVGSWAHGWIHRIVYLKGDNYAEQRKF